jgi:hypothetical protein
MLDEYVRYASAVHICLPTFCLPTYTYVAGVYIHIYLYNVYPRHVGNGEIEPFCHLLLPLNLMPLCCMGRQVGRRY